MAAAASPTTRVLTGDRATPPEKRPAKKPVSRRTTVTLSPETMEIVERFQQATGLSMSEAISEIIERSEPRPPRIRLEDGFPTADIKKEGKWITTEDILRAENEPW